MLASLRVSRKVGLMNGLNALVVNGGGEGGSGSIATENANANANAACTYPACWLLLGVGGSDCERVR